ncbi:hypothetical protein GGR50DRAFT_112156 [Xylaria sp. CBS 124048]|nr:hypothetical protein GGR50DRAFT_112156 [Xylaria sp. CBS 124048]
MDSQTEAHPDAIERWALLVGIDYYFPGNERPISISPLRGCVRDVLELTASHSDNDTGIKEKDPHQWPTHDNIMARLDTIRERASPGALVYIHYSGHGVLRRAIGLYGEGGNKITGTALVLTDVLQKGAYLSGYQLGVKVKRMVESKNLRVTLVLDSCNSGHGMRTGDPNIAVRCVDEIDQSQLDSDKKADDAAAAEDGKRLAEAQPSWLDEPHSCTVLTACNPFQSASETAFGSVSREKNGVFTHWMLDMLREYPKARLPSYSQVRGHVQFKTTSTQDQTPGVFGDTMHEFFGLKVHPWVPSCHIAGEDGKYFLAAGAAQCVAEQAIYEIRPAYGEIDTGNAQDASNWRPPRVRVTNVYDLRSKAEAIFAEDAPRIDELIRLGQHASLYQWALPSQTYVSILNQDQDGRSERSRLRKFWRGDGDNMLSKIWVKLHGKWSRWFDSESDTDKPSRLDKIEALLKKELEITPNLLLKTTKTSQVSDFQIIVGNNDQSAIICDSGRNPLAGLPSISLRDGSAIGRLAEFLRHAARFQAIKELRYGKPMGSNLLTDQYFSYEVYDSYGKPMVKNAAGQYQVKDGQEIRFVFKANSGGQPLYATLLDLEVNTWARKPGTATRKLCRYHPSICVHGVRTAVVG